MARHLWTVLCQKALVDREDGSTSLIQCVEDMTISGKPLLPEENGGRPVVLEAPMDLVSSWERTSVEAGAPDEVEFRVKLILPNGEEIAHRSLLRMALEGPRHRSIMKINGIPYHGPGRYEWIVEQRDGADRWKAISSAPFVVSIKPPDRSVSE